MKIEFEGFGKKEDKNSVKLRFGVFDSFKFGLGIGLGLAVAGLVIFFISLILGFSILGSLSGVGF
jgi:hypothetical protein